LQFDRSAGAARARQAISTAALVLVLLCLAGTFLLISPPTEGSYPGAIPWSPRSLLHALIGFLSLGDVAPTARGVEIKDLAFHLFAAAMALLLAARAVVSALHPAPRRLTGGPWQVAQVALAAWVAVSAASMLWTRDPQIAGGQALLYLLWLLPACAIGWTLESVDIPRAIWGLLITATCGAVLCVWYYYERNPFNRPGFPLGNPSVVAACVLPAILIALSVSAERIRRLIRRDWTGQRGLLIAAALLVPLVWAFRLADSRSAGLAAMVALAAGAIVVTRGRLRLALVGGALLVALVGVVVVFSQSGSLVMARGASLRFRYYAWKYAAFLWSERPFSGHGAGAYPRLGGGHSWQDRALDPAAFMGEIVEHAHNELFEVLAEIGLVGGVTFVAGALATLAAGAAIARANLSPARRALHVGLFMGVVALFVDACGGVGPRLPGVPAVLAVLVGLVWAESRCAASRAADSAAARWRGARWGFAAAALLLAGIAGWAAQRNWQGVRAEYAGIVLGGSGDAQAALPKNEAAEARLLDPVRVLIAREREVRLRFQIGRAAYQAASDAWPEAPPPSEEAEQMRRDAVRACVATYEAAARVHQTAPSVATVFVYGARAAEMVFEMKEAVSDPNAALWYHRAIVAWRDHRLQRPTDATTLLAMIKYPMLLADSIGLLRDALRSGWMTQEWYAAFRDAAKREEFEATLTGMVATIAPYSAESEPDSLSASRAPEMLRLAAQWQTLQRAYDQAAQLAGQAAEMYAALRSRLPELESVTLAEQAEYVFRAAPARAAQAEALVRRAIERMPVIQAQKYEESLVPYRWALARFVLAQSREAAAAEILRGLVEDPTQIAPQIATLYIELAQTFLGATPDERPDVEPWLRAALEHNPADARARTWLLMLVAERRDAGAVRAIFESGRAAGLSDETLVGIARAFALLRPDDCQWVLGQLAEFGIAAATSSAPASAPAGP